MIHLYVSLPPSIRAHRRHVQYRNHITFYIPLNYDIIMSYNTSRVRVMRRTKVAESKMKEKNFSKLMHMV